jgi:hypothetical protein
MMRILRTVTLMLVIFTICFAVLKSSSAFYFSQNEPDVPLYDDVQDEPSIEEQTDSDDESPQETETTDGSGDESPQETEKTDNSDDESPQETETTDGSGDEPPQETETKEATALENIPAAVQAAVRLEMYNNNLSEETNTVSPWFKLYNTGETPIELEDLKIRYFYTIDGETGQSFWCDWSNIGASNVTGSFVKMPVSMVGADYYLNIGFSSNAGVLYPGENIELQNRFAKIDWSNYIQSDDFSFNSNGKKYSDWNEAAVYYKDSLIWGIEPSETAPVIVPVTSIRLEVSVANENDRTNTLFPRYILTNTGNTAINLSDVKIRYYYTNEGKKPQNFWCDWSSADARNVTGRFAENGFQSDTADCFCETGFTGGAGLLQPGKSVEIHTRIAKKDWSDYRQFNDYSFTGSQKYITWDKVAVLINGELFWGNSIIFGKPAGLKAEAYENAIKLTWMGLEGASAYEIENDNQIIGTVSGTSFEHTDLNWGTVYSYRVRGISGTLHGEWSDAVSALTFSSPPHEINSISGENQITIYWNDSAGADIYDIEADGQLIENIGCRYIHTELEPGTQHTYRIRAKNSSGVGRWSEYFTIYTLPPVVTGIQPFATQDVISVTWDDTQGASSYEVLFDGQIYECGFPSFTKDGLLPGTEYSLKIRAVNESGAGQWSDTVSYWTIPGIVRNISGNATTADISLSWDDATGATGYDIEVDGQIIEDQTSPYSHMQLSPGTRHVYRVRAKNASGVGTWSESVTVWTIPDVVNGLVLHPQLTEIMVEWEPVDGAHGYDLEVNGAIIPDVEQPYNNTGLLPGKYYEYRVRAKNSSGAGEWSAPIGVRTIPGTVRHVISQADENTIFIECEPVEGADIYDIEVDGVLHENVEFPYVCQDLLPGTEHKFRFRAANSSGVGEWSEETIVWTLPDVPVNIIQSAEETFITVMWDNVTGAFSFDIEADGEIIRDVGNPYVHAGLLPGTVHRYRVRAKNSSGEGKWSDEYTKITLPGLVAGVESSATKYDITLVWEQVTGSDGYDISINGVVTENVSSPYTFTDLLPGTEYKINIRAVNSSGKGRWNEETAVWTLPDAPQNIQAAAASGSISLKWDVAKGATGYEVEIFNTPVSAGEDAAYIHYGLSPNTQYTYRVRAVNSSGAGEWSDIVAKTTLPAVPNGIRSYSSSNNIRLDWDDISGAIAYDIEVDGKIIFDIGESSYDHTDLQSNSVHIYRIRSKNDESAGEWSDEIHAATLMAAPDFLTCESSTDKIEIAWSAVEDATGYDIEVDGKLLDNGAQTSFAHSGLDADTGHVYRVRARNGDFPGAWSSYIYCYTLCNPPDNISIDVDSTSIKIEWDLLQGASGYEVEFDGEVIDNGLSGNYTRSGLAPLSEHKIRVRAIKNNKPGAWSGYITGVTLVGTPSGVSSVEQSDRVNISWDPVPGATGYELMFDGNIVYAGIQNEYLQTGLEPNTVHFYRIRARNGETAGKWSETYTCKTLIGTPANLKFTTESNRIIISWDKVAGAVSYDIEADNGVIEGNVNLFFIHDQLEPNTTHQYRVRARSESGLVSEWSALAAVTTTIGVPKGIKADATTSGITLSWENVDDAISYDLEADGIIIKDITANYYTHKNLKPNTQHTYRIRSKSNASVSEWSRPIVQSTVSEVAIQIKNDNIFNFVIVVPPATDGADRIVIVEYTPEELEVFDLCAITAEPELETGRIEGTGISVEEFSPGKIIYKIAGSAKTEINIIKFLSKTFGNSSVTYAIK